MFEMTLIDFRQHAKIRSHGSSELRSLRGALGQSELTIMSRKATKFVEKAISMAEKHFLQ